MARLQSLIQQHSLERGLAPTSTRMISGMSGVSEGVPKMHPLKSSMPILRASSMIHSLRIKTPRMMKMPSMRMPGLRLPKL